MGKRKGLQERILGERDAGRLSAFLKVAAKAESVERFIEEMCLK